MKDYYKIMNVPYDATQEEIRKAYHLQAKKFHPDKNPGNAEAAARFLTIQEAYGILSDENLRKKFHLQSRYPLNGKKQASGETAETILHKCNALNRKIAATDKYRINPKAIAHAIDSILSEKNIRILITENKQSVSENVIRLLLSCLQSLPYRMIAGCVSRLLLLAGNQQQARNLILQFNAEKRKNRYWENYNLGIIVLVTVLICLLILFLST